MLYLAMGWFIVVFSIVCLYELKCVLLHADDSCVSSSSPSHPPFVPSVSTVQQFAVQNGMRFFLVSARSGACVDDLFRTLAEDIAELRKQTGRGRTGYDSSLDDATLSLHSHLTATGSTRTAMDERGSVRLSNLETSIASEAETHEPRQQSSGCSC